MADGILDPLWQSPLYLLGAIPGLILVIPWLSPVMRIGLDGLVFLFTAALVTGMLLRKGIAYDWDGTFTVAGGTALLLVTIGTIVTVVVFGVSPLIALANQTLISVARFAMIVVGIRAFYGITSTAPLEPQL